MTVTRIAAAQLMAVPGDIPANVAAHVDFIRAAAPGAGKALVVASRDAHGGSAELVSMGPVAGA